MKDFVKLRGVQVSALGMIIIGALSSVVLSALINELDGPEAMIFLLIIPIMFAVIAMNLLWSMVHCIICFGEARRTGAAAAGYLVFHGFSAAAVFLFSLLTIARIFSSKTSEEITWVLLLGMPVGLLPAFVASIRGLRNIREGA